MTSDPSQVAIVVLCWNGWPDTRECLHSLARVPARVILVDNHSSDGTASRVSEEFPDVELLVSDENHGFARGNNRGILHALRTGATHVMLLNNDTVVDPEFLPPLLRSLEAGPALGFACPHIYYASSPDTRWFEAGTIDWSRGIPHYCTGSLSDPQPIPIGTGCCVIARRETWQAVGLLDERYFLYWEDADWTYRVTLAGGHGLVVPASRIWHKVSRSSERIDGVGSFYYGRNGLLFNQLHAPPGNRTMARFVIWRLREHARAARIRAPGWFRALVLEAYGGAAFLAGRFGAAPEQVAWLASRLTRAPRSRSDIGASFSDRP